jgi:hypothetical protein
LLNFYTTIYCILKQHVWKHRLVTLPKTNNSRYRKTRTENKSGKLLNGDRLYFSADKLTNLEYHSITNAVSSSALKELYYGKNPSYCYKKYIERIVPHKQSDAMLIGSATHKLILEPSTFNHEFAVFNGRKAGKAWIEFKEEHGHQDIITQVQYNDIQKMRDAVLRCPEAAQLLSGGEAEQSVFWRDEETGVLCRARADYKKIVNGKTILVDLKTCISAEPEKFAKDLVNLGYPLQEAMYREGFQADAFAFVAVEKVTNTVQVYTLDDLFDQAGHFIFRQALERWAELLPQKQWPSYREGVTQLDCPEWFANKVLAYE